MPAGHLNAIHRSGTGKSVTRKIRADGKIPGIVYGKGGEPLPIAVDPEELLKALDPEKKSNTLIQLAVGGAGRSEVLTVMLRDWQNDVLRGHVCHADFVRVRLDQDVHATVPVLIVGKAEGVKNGGTLHQVFRSLELACTPDRIPTRIEVNVERLAMGESIHVRDLTLGQGVRALIDGSQTVCVVTAPRVEKVAEVAEVAEGVEVAAEAAKTDGKAAAKPVATKAAAGKAAAGKVAAKPDAKAGAKADRKK